MQNEYPFANFKGESKNSKIQIQGESKLKHKLMERSGKLERHSPSKSVFKQAEAIADLLTYASVASDWLNFRSHSHGIG